MKRKLIITVALILSFLVFIAVILTSINKRVTRKVAPPKALIAIVIDDWGYNLNNLGIIAEIKAPLTCAILPNLKNSGLLSQRLNNLGFEIILHLPMEPKEKYRLEKYTILKDMDAAEIRNILNQDLSSISFVKGVSNHMGSRITEDRLVSAIVISEVKKRKLYFLDSFVTPKSVCASLAEKIKIRFAKRDIFLDNLDDPGYIRGQIIKLRNLAKKNGQAVGIGHDRRNTLIALKEALPQLVKSGYKLVFVSEIAK